MNDNAIEAAIDKDQEIAEQFGEVYWQAPQCPGEIDQARNSSYSGLPPCRSRSRQRDRQWITAQHHQDDQPPDRRLAVGVGADELGDVADWRGFGPGLRPLATTLARSRH